MIHVGESFFRWLLQTSWQAAVLVGLILLAQLVFRKQISAGWRYGLWFLLIVRLLMPTAPPSALSIFNLPWFKSPGRALAFAPTTKSENWAPREEADKASSIRSEFKPQSLPALLPAPAISEPMTSATKVERTSRINWFELAFWTWVSGASCLGLRLAWRNVRFQSLIRREGLTRKETLLREFGTCRAIFEIRWEINLVETRLVESPAVYGLWRKYLLLPAGISERFSARELHCIFLHELAHIKRRDLEINWLAAVLQILHWFNPVLWFAFSRMRADRELATDALALSRAAKGESASYGETIIKLAEWLIGPAKAPALVGIAEDKKEIKRRIIMIARAGGRKPWPIISLALLFVVATFACTDILESNSNKRAADSMDVLGEAGASSKAEKLITALKQKSRWTFGPKAVLFGDEDGEVSGGLVRSVQIRSYAMSSDELGALGGVVASGLPPASAAEAVQWNLEKDLTSSDGLIKLMPKATVPATKPEFSFVETAIGGNTATVLKFSAGTCFELSNPFKDPAGNPLLVDYTVIMDVMFPDMKSRWAALWQTDPRNVSDAEWLVSSEKGLGITDTYGGRVPEGEWHRLALVVRGSEATFLSYIDGKEVQRKYLDVKDEYYNRRLDDDVLSWTDAFSKLRNLGDPTASRAVAKFNLRLENGLRNAQPGTVSYSPSGPTVNDSNGQIAAAQGWAAQLSTTDLMTALKQKSRWTLGPKALLFADENGENAGGVVHGVQVRNYAMTEREIQEMEGQPLESTRRPEVPFGAQIEQWDFKGNLDSATGGAALISRKCSPATEPEVSFESMDGNSGKSKVARFSRGTYFELATGFGGSDSEKYLLNYTVILDVKFEQRPVGWVSLWQNDTANRTDADWFINKKGQLGIRDFYGGSIADGTWNRLTLVVDGKNGTLSHFVNGQKVRTKLMILEDDFGRRGGAEPNLNFIIGLINELKLRNEPQATELLGSFTRRMHNHPDPENTYRFLPFEVQVADKNGEPMADATIDFQLADSNEDFFPEFVKTDASGRGQIKVQIPVAERVHITARAPGHAPRSLTVRGQEILSGTKAMVQLALVPAMKIGGAVIDQQSNSVANAVIRIISGDGAPADATVRGWSELVQTTSDGRWTADFIPQDAQKLTVVVYDPLYAARSFVIERNNPQFDELKNLSSTFQLQRNEASAAR
jgi:beta-lactamase regulating signal transducer with metallopeptidase domain